MYAPPKSEPGEIPLTIDDLRALALGCTEFFLGHDAEPDPVDLFVEFETVDQIARLIDVNTFGRTHMGRLVIMHIMCPISRPLQIRNSTTSRQCRFSLAIYNIYLQISNFSEALSVAARLNDVG